MTIERLLALGDAWHQSQQTEVPTRIVDPATDGVEPPAIVREFIGALGSGDNDAVRSALAPEPHARLIGEFKRFDIQRITGVETLSTHVDGARSATNIVMQGTTTGGVPISINLVILADGNTIKSQLGAGVTAKLYVDRSLRAGADGSGRVFLWATDPSQPGSSISHWDVLASPNLLMEPFLNSDLEHALDLTVPLLKDLGWSTSK